MTPWKREGRSGPMPRSLLLQTVRGVPRRVSFLLWILETMLRVVRVKDLVAVPVNREQCVSASLPGILGLSRRTIHQLIDCSLQTKGT